MSEKLKSNLLKYGINAGVCGLITVFCITTREFDALALVDRYRVLSDAFFIPGILSILSGALMWVAGEGALDGVGYVMSYAFHALMPGSEHKGERYSDYRERKHGKKPAGYGFLFIVGAVFVAVAMVFSALFYSLYS